MFAISPQVYRAITLSFLKHSLQDSHLIKGLRIAPPEAPVTGYMFGKGIYFADMVSKSANYCNTSRSNNTGILMLCDVALGSMYERKAADYIEKLPKGKHSTKGLGKKVNKAANIVNILLEHDIFSDISQQLDKKRRTFRY